MAVSEVCVQMIGCIMVPRSYLFVYTFNHNIIIIQNCKKQLSRLSFMQYMGLHVIRWLISLLIIMRMFLPHLIVIFKSEWWLICHWLGLGHGTMVCALCLTAFLLIIKNRPLHPDNFPDSKVNGPNTGPTWVLSAPDGPYVEPCYQGSLPVY